MADFFCSADEPDWVVKDCGAERGGIIAVGLIALDENPSQANLESKAYWQARIAASPQSYFLIQPTRGEYPGGTPTKEDGFGLTLFNVTGADHSASVEVQGLYANQTFFEAVNLRKYKVVFFTAANLMIYVNTPVTVYGTPMNPKSIKAGAFWKISFDWTSMSNPAFYNTPSTLLLTD